MTFVLYNFVFISICDVLKQVRFFTARSSKHSGPKSFWREEFMAEVGHGK